MAALGLPSEPVHFQTGGFKAVFRMQNAAGVTEALKAVWLPDSADQVEDADSFREQMVARATREVQALGQCQSPHLVKLGSVPATPQQLDTGDYLVYSEEFLPGEALGEWLRKQYRPDFDTLRLLASTLIDLIRTLFDLGYLHRDIKPENVMDTGLPDRRFVVLDLGIAFKMHGTRLTQPGFAPGTRHYMAPEVFDPTRRHEMDVRRDLYSAALTVYVLASGRHPFAPNPESTVATIYRILHDRPPPLHTLRPDLPADFCRLVDRCIKKDPALRYAKLEQALHDLERCQA